MATTTNTMSWRRGRSFGVPSVRLTSISCPSHTANLEQSLLPASPANKQHDYLGPDRVNTSP